MNHPRIDAATETHRSRVLQTITLGFAGDPVARWIWPEPDTYLQSMPKFADAFGGAAFDHGTAYVVDTYKAASLWLPPGTTSDEDRINEIFAATVRPEIAHDLEGMFEQMGRYHPSDQQCWYLPMIAADPAHIGRGLGAAILKHVLRECDGNGHIAYLESSNPRSISLYQRHGFEILGKIVAGDAPPMFPMLREPH